MTETLTRAEQLRYDLDNLHFTCKYHIGVLAELEQLGRTHTRDYQNVKRNVEVLQNNIRRVEAELEAEETKALEEEADPYYFSDGMHW